MRFKGTLLQGLVAAIIATAFLLAPASSALAASTSASEVEYSVTGDNTCTIVVTVSEYQWTPIIGDPQYRVDAKITRNGCGTGVEAALEGTNVLTGDNFYTYGGDVKTAGSLSEASTDAAQNNLVRYGFRYWTSQGWVYKWVG